MFNKGFRFLLCVFGIFSKYAWVVPLKDKKGVSIVDDFQKILDDSNRKPNKIRVDKGSEFYNNSFKKWLKDNDIEMYLVHNRSSHQRCSIKKGVLRNFAKFTRKHLCQSLFFNKVAGLRPATLLEKGL